MATTEKPAAGLTEEQPEQAAPEQLPIPNVPDSTRERNERKASKDANDNRCRICSNPVVASGAWHIHENGNGANMGRADLGEDTTGTDTYGWQPIGPECAKRVPAAYRTRIKF